MVMTMNTQRGQLYRELQERIGKTPLVEYTGEIPNGNKVWIKRECDNPFGSHYDRVYLALFQHYEKQGKIKPGDKVLETTSGSAGVSFAGIGRILGYDCTIAIPAGGEKARVQAIREQDAEIIFTDESRYIAGFPEFIKDFLREHPDYFFMNHSMGKKGTNNEVTLGALEEIAKEITEEIVSKKINYGSKKINYFVSAVGNGSNVLGIGRALPKSTQIIAFETVQSAVLYDLKFPWKYEDEFGIVPGSLPRHSLPGTSYQGIDFPHIRNAVPLVSNVILVSDAAMDRAYTARTGRRNTEQLPHWDAIPQFSDVGRTTRAGIAVALSLTKWVLENNILIIGYDKAERYDVEV